MALSLTVLVAMTAHPGSPSNDHDLHDQPPKVRRLVEQLAQGWSRGVRRPGMPHCPVQRRLAGGGVSGARCDNRTDDTAALQAAIDGCGAGGVVELPPGKTCLSQTLKLRNGTRLGIPAGSSLKGYPHPLAWNNASLWLIEMFGVRDVVLFGGGTIDGSGGAWWAAPGGGRPHLFRTGGFRNFPIRDMRLVNSGRGMLGLGAPCHNVMVDNVQLIEPAIGNSDGIDVSCDGFVVQNSHVENGDDSICMKSTALGSASNGLIRNCTVRNGAQLLPATRNYPGKAGGLVLGTAVAPAMENITYRNCSVDGALAGIRIKFRTTQAGFARNIRFDGIRIVNPVAYAIDVVMTSDHMLMPGQPGGLRTVDLQNVTISDVDGVLGPVPAIVCGKGQTCPRAVGRFSCTPEFPCHGINLARVHVRGFKPSPRYLVPCVFTNASGSGVDVEPAACTPPAEGGPWGVEPAHSLTT